VISAGNVDIRERFVRRAQRVPELRNHRRISAQDTSTYWSMKGRARAVRRLKSADPLKFENYAERVQAAIKRPGRSTPSAPATRGSTACPSVSA